MSAYISELSYAGGSTQDFVEIAAPKGIDLSGYSIAIYNSAGNVVGTFSLGSAVNTVAGTDVYVLDNGTAGFVSFGTTDSVALVDDLGNVVQFVSWSGNTTSASTGPAAGMTSTDIGTASYPSSLETGDEGSSYSAQSSPNSGTVPCYAPGTMIDTPDGPRAVETLGAGDLLLTDDHGPQPIRWVRRGDHKLEDVPVEDKPILIRTGALGPGRPDRDLIVSPQHRILIGGARQLTGYCGSKAFAPAKSLTKLPGIRHMKGKRIITWVHFACDRHEVVTANGCLSESLLVGPMVLNGLTRAERRTVAGILGAGASPDCALNGPAAYPCLKVGEVRRVLATHVPPKRFNRAEELRRWNAHAEMDRETCTLQARRANQKH